MDLRIGSSDCLRRTLWTDFRNQIDEYHFNDPIFSQAIAVNLYIDLQKIGLIIPGIHSVDFILLMFSRLFRLKKCAFYRTPGKCCKSLWSFNVDISLSLLFPV